MRRGQDRAFRDVVVEVLSGVSAVLFFFFFQAEDGIRDLTVTGVQTCALPILMVEGFFLPNSPTLMNAGRGNDLQYSACYVLPVGDSMQEIFDSVKAAAIIDRKSVV